MSWSNMFSRYFNGQIHDETQVWHSRHRCWYRCAELKLMLVSKCVAQTRRRLWWEDWYDSEP
jgi:hypothetical protein